MAQAEQFMLRINTYGPDLLEGDTMPKYRELVEEVITPKFAADFEKNAPLAEATVKQAGLGAQRRGLQHRRLRDRLRLRHRAGGRLVHPVLPEEPGLRRAGARPSRRRSGSRSRWSRSRARGWSTTSRPLTGDAEDTTGAAYRRRHRHHARSRPRGRRRDARPGTTCSASSRDASARRDPGRLEGRHRRPRPGRPAVPHPQRGRRGAARPGPAGGVRRDAGAGGDRARARGAEPAARRRRPGSLWDVGRPRGGAGPHPRHRPGLAARRLAVVVALLLAAAGYLVTQPSDDAIADGDQRRPGCGRAGGRPRSWPTTTGTSTTTRRPPAR